MTRRSIAKITRNHWHNGFLGAGHKAMAVLDGTSFKESDPFILFMDDSLNLPGGKPVGGPHPHAGFETLTLVLEGNGKDWETGSFELMTAGKGIIHTEEITSKQQLRILQVWLVLPPEERWAPPRLQRILLEDVPKIRTADYEVRVYSGTSNGLASPLKNHTPFTLVDFRLNRNAEIHQEIPAHYNGLVYVLKGSIVVGDKMIKAEEAGWLSPSGETGEMLFRALEDDTRFVLYAGQPHNVPVIHHGPFVADSTEDIAGLYREFRGGAFPHLNELPTEWKVNYRIVDGLHIGFNF
ncbi:pirin family protein [Parapedobacter lycopersici]|uniref:pirin family protein n=1 Tax=Parapedobacter lycopersici TaxID=1864939 RepID=UPI00214D48A3|nr:pirin-like C-terminal cupin domain-containing protein [Parapedobacter lycopersici]